MKISILFNRILQHRLLTHILYWLTLILIAIVYGMAYGEPLTLSITLKKISLPAQIMATYLFVYVQLPLLYNKKYVSFTISLLIATYFFHIVMHVCNDLWFGKSIISYHPNHTFIEILQSAEYYLLYTINIYMVVFVTAGIKLIKSNLEHKKESERLEAEKAKKEYQYLQSRMQPDFLLNTLKQIEIQSKTNNMIAAQSIADLSDILDYSLYQSAKDSISLQIEIAKMETFVQLYASGSTSISSIQMTQSSIPVFFKIKPMTIIKIMDRTLDYLSTLETKSNIISIETTMIEKDILLDINIFNKKMKELDSKLLKESVAKNTSKYIIDVSAYPSKGSCNIQIRITSNEKYTHA